VARNYTLKRRADSQAETRRRIVEAAVELHSTLGPSKTTVSMIAEKAGVQRHTFYAHFPDERAMLMACSGHSLEADPLPDAQAWREISDKAERLKVGLRTVYDWYARNESLLACVLRDAEHYGPVQEIMALRYAPGIGAWHDALGEKLDAKRRTLLTLALSYHTWRTLAREAGLKQSDAVKTMMNAIIAG
jgi:AcrR family transcriptional regulator